MDEPLRAAARPGAAAMPGAPEDPRVVRSRTRIVEAATTHFLEHGYLAANLDDIARRAGVAKRTIHNQFGTKEQLFRDVLAVVIDTAERFAADVVGPLGRSEDVAGDLRAVGLRLARVVLVGRVVPLRRLLIGEAPRFPELARDYYDRAPGRVLAALADALRELDARGRLAIDDAQLAAEHLAFLVLGASLDRALFTAVDEPLPVAEVEARAEAGVAAFLRLYVPGR